MRSDYDNELVKRAIIHIKAGELDTARRYLERALDAADDPDTKTQASYWLSALTDDPSRKRALLEDVLAYNRNHPEARRALAILDGKLNPGDIVDANTLPPQSAPDAPQPANADRFTCPKCGAHMVFAPDGRSLYCEHCTRHETLSTSRGQGLAEQDFFTAMATQRGHRKPVSMHAFACQGCGAEFVLAPEVISATCAYCGSPHVVNTPNRRELLEPDAVIAFAFDQPTATRRLVKFVAERGITPEGMVQPPRGIYLPAWTFDVGGEVPYSGQIVTRSRGRAISVQQVSGSAPVFINDIPVPAERKLGKLFARALPGYDFRAAVVYDPRYLADWPAEVYQMSMSDASLEARAQAAKRVRRDVRVIVGLDVEDLTISTSNLSVEAFKLVLVPAWHTSIPFGGRNHPVLINGQTAQVTSDLPKKNKENGLGGLLNTLFGG